MSTVKQGMLTLNREWAKHLRPKGKQEFWSKERAAKKMLLKKELEEWYLEN